MKKKSFSLERMTVKLKKDTKVYDELNDERAKKKIFVIIHTHTDFMNPHAAAAAAANDIYRIKAQTQYKQS